MIYSKWENSFSNVSLYVSPASWLYLLSRFHAGQDAPTPKFHHQHDNKKTLSDKKKYIMLLKEKGFK
jgi:hypothetical protein